MFSILVRIYLASRDALIFFSLNTSLDRTAPSSLARAATVCGPLAASSCTFRVLHEQAGPDPPVLPTNLSLLVQLCRFPSRCWHPRLYSVE